MRAKPMIVAAEPMHSTRTSKRRKLRREPNEGALDSRTELDSVVYRADDSVRPIRVTHVMEPFNRLGWRMRG